MTVSKLVLFAFDGGRYELGDEGRVTVRSHGKAAIGGGLGGHLWGAS